ncbi:hypothetical protein GW846_01620 [Candidatus Gracilibacteria bacterium]|nr:hypothetical protein [Candidatus Gracilibacteria bacterium]
MWNFIKLLFGIHKKTISSLSYQKFLSHTKSIEKLSASEQIVQYDKVYHHILQELGYSGTFGEILKRTPKEITNIQDIWTLHKLRNTLVHELEKHNQLLLSQQAGKYRKIIISFLKQVKN